ncbi:MAG: hypothetical protein GX442_09765 [Candidatus Riflebacteria bacterium]|nr:hypothetical protein [Candidatus Riflebacteria bacterium]
MRIFAHCLCLVLLLSAGWMVSPLGAEETTAAAASTPTGKILFVDTSEAGKTFLATINPDGTGKTRLTPSYFNIVFPKSCETSGWMGFTNKTPDMKSEVYLLSRDAKKIKKILEGAALEGFSPNGKFLIYTTCDMKAELFVYSIESKTATQISQNLRVTAADWSPDSEWIAVSVLVEDGTNDLYMISTMAQGIIRLTQTPGVDESFPVFTKDGKYLAFISNRNGENEIEYLDLHEKKFQRPLIMGMYPSVSPDKNWVAFEKDGQIGISQGDGLNTKVLTAGRTPWWIR